MSLSNSFMQPADALQRFVESIGDRHEASFWLALFRAEAKERFATIVIEAPVLLHAFDAVVVDLRYLAQVGLFPVVATGLYDVNSTTSRAAALHQGLEAAGVAAKMFADAGATSEPIVEATRAGIVPIVALGSQSGVDVAHRVVSLSRLLAALETRKLILLRREGALRRNNERLQSLNLTSELEPILQGDGVSTLDRSVLVQAKRLLLQLVPHRMTMAVTSPLELLRELFTVKGAGTLLRRGSVLWRHAGFVELDQQRLADLLERSFGRGPTPSFFASPVSWIYLEDAYRGAAIVLETPLWTYLSKFAVDRQAQGEGMGRDLWMRVVGNHPVLLWRARPGNAINGWYTKEADGFVRTQDWLVFWRGLEVAAIPDAVRFALAQPEDLPLPG